MITTVLWSGATSICDGFIYLGLLSGMVCVQPISVLTNAQQLPRGGSLRTFGNGVPSISFSVHLLLMLQSILGSVIRTFSIAIYAIPDASIKDVMQVIRGFLLHPKEA